ncbi:MAG: hypothetical protein ABSH32_36090 [Bryobacteraceae bacterium]
MERILALEIRPKRVGFIVLKGRDQVLDWGVRTYGKRETDAPSACCAKVGTLLELYAPGVMVIRRRNRIPKQGRGTIRAIAAKLAAEARRRSMVCWFVTAEEVKNFFARHECTTKDAVATRVAEWLPDLWKLPTPRTKPWHPERFSMPVFDAAAAALAFLGESRPYHKVLSTAPRTSAKRSGAIRQLLRGAFKGTDTAE